MNYKINSKTKQVSALVFRIQPNKNISLTSYQKVGLRPAERLGVAVLLLVGLGEGGS